MGTRSNLEADLRKPAELHVAIVNRRIHRDREKRGRRQLPAQPLPVQMPAPDPVRLAVLAMESLGRASLRASFTGTEVRVAVPDAATAAIFQAALDETSRSRSTDRLIRIVID